MLAFAEELFRWKNATQVQAMVVRITVELALGHAAAARLEGERRVEAVHPQRVLPALDNKPSVRYQRKRAWCTSMSCAQLGFGRAKDRKSFCASAVG